ncbi:Eco57I restriction-modification methylase domain-containing protein, partial [Cyclobacteriaceae bacterium]|nr:Eco57I restriction-modification methylase domain-containing protein [Cyclobacteriaceae bacterium]
LGYTLSPKPNYNIATEYKNESNSKKADGAILKDGQAIAVIELKGTKTKDLDSITNQGFGYKHNQTGCVYVITSNFEKLRFYINDSVNKEEFDLFNLSYERFELMYLCLHKDKIFSGEPLAIKESSIREEEGITKKFYAAYSLFKRELYRDLVKENMKNEVFRAELEKEDQESVSKNIKKTLFKKSQKLIDRFLFIFFGEDRALLPPNSTIKILEQWDKLNELDAYTPLYTRFKQYFNYLDTGRKQTDKSAEIFAYNGGLFKPDAILDSLLIDDQLLYKHAKELSHYDFDSQIDVNILGHIFENSLNEIESVNAEIEGTDFDKQKTKRKKDGVFYTPKYITKYIVDNTVGKLCKEKRAALGIKEEDYLKSRKGRTKTKLQELQQLLKDYREWLLTLTIIDPACGSGAFLNQALDFLINEHESIDALESSLLGMPLVYQGIENTILENNIYGVDLNEESIEIAKLSLWLRTAQPRRKLNDLSSNIKCGNSLIDVKAVAGDKAFKWEEEFPEVFAKGGFDVVIGNPPYVRVQHLSHEEIDWYKSTKKTAHKRVDISILFFEQGHFILKDKGILSFITSNQFISAEYGRGCRDFFLNNYKIEEVVDFGDLPIFEGALTYVSIFTLSKSDSSDFRYHKVSSLLEARNTQWTNSYDIDVSVLHSDPWVLQDPKVNKLIKRLSSLRELSEIGNCNYGIVSGDDSVFILDNKKIEELGIENGVLLPLLRANNCRRYQYVSHELYVLYPYHEIDDKTILMNEETLMLDYPNAYSYLLSNKDRLSKRKDSRKTFEGRPDWYCLTRFGKIEMFNQEKIVYPGETKNNKFGIDKNKCGYSGARVFSITLDKGDYSLISLLGVLNSKLIEFYLHNTSPVKAGGYFSYSSSILNKLPVCEPSADLVEVVNIVLEHSTNLHKVTNQFYTYLFSSFGLTQEFKKLQNWYELDFGDFIKELNKAIKKVGGDKLTKMDEMEWMEVFETKKAEVVALKTEIAQTDKQIDQMVYELYDLTTEEIEIVENS